MRLQDKRTPCYEDTDPMPFGKHKDEPLSDVPASYLSWLYNTYRDEGVQDLQFKEILYPGTKIKIQLYNYLHNSKEALQMEFPNFGE
jgi:uncharacterized protein (DUF3820 family)